MVVSPGNLVAAAFAHGLVVVGFIYAYGHISGTHINPAVTLGLLIAGEIEFVAAIGYWIVQFLGGIFGALMLKAVLPEAGDLGVTILETGVTPGQGLVVEIVLTFFLVNTIFNTAVSRKMENFAGLADWTYINSLYPYGRPVDTGCAQPLHGRLGLLSSVEIMPIFGSISWGPFVGGSLAAFLYIGVLKNKKET